MFGLLNMPEIERETQYIDTTCSIVDELTKTVPFLVCGESSRSCVESLSRTSCSVSMTNYNNHDKYNLDPNLISVFEGPCSAGYMCCQTYCETCTRCSTSCSRRFLGRGRAPTSDGDEKDNFHIHVAGIGANTYSHPGTYIIPCHPRTAIHEICDIMWVRMNVSKEKDLVVCLFVCVITCPHILLLVLCSYYLHNRT